ncbi:MAG: phytoene/squalene synthase family protein [Candidatus Hydrogenedentota bacterium]
MGRTTAWRGRETDWTALEERTRAAMLEQMDEEAAWLAGVASARRVLRNYSTSFYLVTRFLPAPKRHEVEAIYAAVRYPDEIVDTFALNAGDSLGRLEALRSLYRTALEYPSLRERLRNDIPWFLALFARVVRNNDVPPPYYEAFLDAMARDARPRPFATLDNLIAEYVYGSAIVVGYFLAYVYGPHREDDFPRAMDAARSLGIALQLTNSLRDVAEDHRLGRLYLPVDMLQEEGLESDADPLDSAQQVPLARVIRRVADFAEEYYQAATRDLDAFAPDSRTAIHACIEVYGQLNQRIAESPRHSILHRVNVPVSAKFRVLPTSKYWRLPLAYLRP